MVVVGVLLLRMWSPCTWSIESFKAVAKVSVAEPRLTEALVVADGFSGSGVFSMTSPAAACWMSGLSVLAVTSNAAGAALEPCNKMDGGFTQDSNNTISKLGLFHTYGTSSRYRSDIV